MSTDHDPGPVPDPTYREVLVRRVSYYRVPVDPDHQHDPTAAVAWVHSHLMALPGYEHDRYADGPDRETLEAVTTP